MKIITKDTEINYTQIIEKFKHISFDKALFFDIETTGFSAKNTKIYMIGCLYAKPETGTFHSTQWFLDNYNDEAAMICAFMEFSNSYNTLIHYNGHGFDIPYMESKCKKYNIMLDFSRFLHIDLYKYASRIKNIFKTENLKQKTMQQFFDLNREDIFSGGDLISMYYEYMETHDPRAMAFLILHNYEDIQGMVTLLDILAYVDIFSGEYVLKSLAIEEYSSHDELPRKETIIELTLNTPIPKRVSFGNQEFFMTAFGNKLKIKIEVYTDELKFFYPNYKDYYYLPKEDMSVHKSVAFYVDKNFRVRAKAANCYSKKTGQFLPQHEEVISPYFKIDYHDKKTYFEITDEFLTDPEKVLQYVDHVLNWLTKIK